MRVSPCELACCLLAVLLIAPAKSAAQPPNLSASFAASPNPISPGQPVNWRLTISNHGPSDALSVRVVFVFIDRHFASFSSTTPGWNLEFSHREGPGWFLDIFGTERIPAGASSTLTVRMGTEATTPGTILPGQAV